MVKHICEKEFIITMGHRKFTLLATLFAEGHAWAAGRPTLSAMRTAPSPIVATSHYDALLGGRPLSALQTTMAELAQIIRQTVDEGAMPSRVWLDLDNGECLTVIFERTRDDTVGRTCTMRVRQSRVLDECSLEEPGGCRDVGCVAVRWNVQTHEAVLVDLFKATKGERLGCDLSSADNRSVKWGQLMVCVLSRTPLLTPKHIETRAVSTLGSSG